MNNIREKLVEIVREAGRECEGIGDDLWDMRGNAEEIAAFMIAHGVTVQEWISVKDRLPEPFVSVLVQMPGEKPFPTVREGFISNDGIWQSAMFRREPGDVTHWQPMPQPPEGE